MALLTAVGGNESSVGGVAEVKRRRQREGCLLTQRKFRWWQKMYDRHSTSNGQMRALEQVAAVNQEKGWVISVFSALKQGGPTAEEV